MHRGHSGVRQLLRSGESCLRVEEKNATVLLEVMPHITCEVCVSLLVATVCL